MPLIEIARRLDARGMACPMPIVKAAQAMRELESGQVLEVLATDPGSVKDFAAWSKATGNELLETTSDAQVYTFVLRKK